MKECHNFASIICAKRRSGKSVLMKDLCHKLYKAGWIEDAYVFSGTAEFQKDLFSYVPEENLYHGMDQFHLKEVWDNQEKKIKTLVKSGVKKETIPCTLVLFDDCVSDTKACRYSELLTRFYVMGRHLNFAVIFITQYFCGLPPIIRDNTDWFACFKIRRQTDRENIVQSYLDVEKKQQGFDILRQITAQPDSYQCMIINLVVNGTDPETYVRTYTASMKIPDFIFEPKIKDKPVFLKGTVTKGFKWIDQ